jgi:hypothetical protein
MHLAQLAAAAVVPVVVIGEASLALHVEDRDRARRELEEAQR